MVGSSVMLGSSPHTRGARFVETIQSGALGIIPAYAGSTIVPHGSSPESADHPRIRGEHLVVGELVAGECGSSPHTRGAQVLGDDLGVHLGIIPAYAGSTFALSNASRWDQDHPRIRGEHVPEQAFGYPQAGSSPHTRGALLRGNAFRGVPGIIPAYAGSTQRRLGVEQPPQDHPRIRGEHCRSAASRPFCPGSSPHTRGARCR